MHPGSSTLTARVLAPIRAALRGMRCEPEVLLSRAGIPLSALGDGDVRISFEQFERFWVEAARASQREDVGLVVGSSIDFSSLDVIAYLAKTSATLREAHHRAARYERLLTDALQTTLEEQGEDAVVTFVAEPTCRALVDFRLALSVGLARTVLGKRPPLRFEIRHGEPRDVRPYLRVLGSVPRFSSDRDAAVFPAAVLDAPLPGADAALCAILEREAERTLATLPVSGGISRAAQKAMAAELGRGEPSLPRIAARLGMTPRTLRRHLHHEGTGHRALLDHLRRQLAERYLDDDQLCIADVASRLGFADSSAFSKAYRRWTGRSPRASTAAARPEKRAIDE